MQIPSNWNYASKGLYLQVQVYDDGDDLPGLYDVLIDIPLAHHAKVLGVLDDSSLNGPAQTDTAVI